jgi:hypothetical protein
MMQVVMIARLHAMYQGSRTMLIFLVIIFLGIIITSGVLVAITLTILAGGMFYLLTCRAQLIGQTQEDSEVILFGILDCAYGYDGDVHLLIAMVWTLNTVWEVLALCLSVWIAVKHFRDLATFRPIDRIDDRGLFQSADKISRALFCEVSL